jgi:lipoprotein Spr
MKKIILATVLLFSVLASQAQTVSAPNTTTDKAPDEQEGLANTYLSQIMGVALSATSNLKLFHLDIKRSSRDIFSMVSPVGKDDLKEGDLVFFKIHSRRISHVGIYLGNNRFAHASSKGVAISSLDDNYYSRYFYKGGRLLAAFKDEFTGGTAATTDEDTNSN